MRILIAILTVLLHPLITSAYSIANHKKITLYAVVDYNIISKEVLDEECVKQLVKGNLSEDKRLFRKLTHWHFYNPSKKLKKRHSLDELFNELTIELDTMIARREPKANIYYKLGQIVHFLQDITCPPHVIPVNHGPSDRFDNLDLDHTYRMERTSHQFHPMMSSELLAPKELLETFSSETHEALKGSFPVLRNGKQEQLTWSYFWMMEGGAKQGFGKYCNAGNCYGSLTFKEKKGKEIINYEVAENIYKEFVRNRLNAAREITIRAILYVEAKIRMRDFH